MCATTVKSTPIGEELKHSLTQLLNTGHSVPEKTSTAELKPPSQDEAWVEVRTHQHFTPYSITVIT